MNTTIIRRKIIISDRDRRLTKMLFMLTQNIQGLITLGEISEEEADTLGIDDMRKYQSLLGILSDRESYKIYFDDIMVVHGVPLLLSYLPAHMPSIDDSLLLKIYKQTRSRNLLHQIVLTSQNRKVMREICSMPSIDKKTRAFACLKAGEDLSYNLLSELLGISPELLKILNLQIDSELDGISLTTSYGGIITLTESDVIVRKKGEYRFIPLIAYRREDVEKYLKSLSLINSKKIYDNIYILNVDFEYNGQSFNAYSLAAKLLEDGEVYVYASSTSSKIVDKALSVLFLNSLPEREVIVDHNGNIYMASDDPEQTIRIVFNRIEETLGLRGG